MKKRNLMMNGLVVLAGIGISGLSVYSVTHRHDAKQVAVQANIGPNLVSTGTVANSVPANQATLSNIAAPNVPTTTSNTSDRAANSTVVQANNLGNTSAPSPVSQPSENLPPGVMGSGDGPFDNSVKPGFDTQLHVMAMFGKAIGLTPIPGGTSPYPDLPTSSPDWGIIHAMMERHVMVTTPPHEFGSNQNMRLREVAGLYASYRSLSTLDEYTPGAGNMFIWGQKVGILNGIHGGYPTGQYQWLGPIDGLCMTPQDTAQMVRNLQTLVRGYSVDSAGVYHMVYPVGNDGQDTFNGGLYTVNPVDGVQPAILKTYQTMNDIWVKPVGNELQVSIPAFSEHSQWRFHAGNKVDYSLNNGANWKTAHTTGVNQYSFYDSQDAKSGGLTSGLPNRVLLRTSLNQPLLIEYYDGKDMLAYVQIGWANGKPTIQRLSADQFQGP